MIQLICPRLLSVWPEPCFVFTAKTPASQDDDDDDEAYDDSFINDDSEEDIDEDSDYVPDDSGGSGKEDVKRLQREAKAFLRKKK